jgi:hypothetical protein
LAFGSIHPTTFSLSAFISTSPNCVPGAIKNSTVGLDWLFVIISSVRILLVYPTKLIVTVCPGFIPVSSNLPSLSDVVPFVLFSVTNILANGIGSFVSLSFTTPISILSLFVHLTN